MIGNACERVLAEIHAAKAFNGIMSAAVVAAVREDVAAPPRKCVHQILVVRVPCLDDVRDPPAPLVPHARVQFDTVCLLGDLVRHEAHRQSPIKLQVEERAEALADDRRVVVEPVPQRVEVGSAVRSAERDGKCLIRGVIINRCTGPEPVAANEVLASAEVGGPVTVDGKRFVEAAGHHRRSAAEAVRQEIFPEQVVVVDPAVKFGARLSR